MTVHTALSAIVLLSVALSTACGTSERNEPVVSPPPLRTYDETRGEVLFMMFCNQCHPGGSAGLGPGLKNKPVPGEAIRLQIREGLGAMPAFGEDEITDDEVNTIIEYITAIQM